MLGIEAPNGEIKLNDVNVLKPGRLKPDMLNPRLVAPPNPTVPEPIVPTPDPFVEVGGAKTPNPAADANPDVPRRSTAMSFRRMPPPIVPVRAACPGPRLITASSEKPMPAG